MNEFEDIEQLLKPQCEFKASETLKQEVMEKAREEIKTQRTIKLWPWLAAACVIGFIVMYLMPPKSATEEKPLVAEKVEKPKAVEEKQMERTPEPVNVKVETPKRRKLHKKNRPFCVKKEEIVEMSEETRLQLQLASLSDDEPQREETDIYDEIRQIRMRGERLISMYNSINN
jgi:hypothetical protein